MPDFKPYVEYGEYNGNETITVVCNEYKGKREQVTMGKRKARAVVDCIKDIMEFVDGGSPRRDLESQADEILRNAGENPKAVGSRDGISF